MSPNFKEILLKNVPKDCIWEDMGNLTNTPMEFVIKAMEESYNQALDDAVQNAQICYNVFQSPEIDENSILKLKV